MNLTKKTISLILSVLIICPIWENSSVLAAPTAAELDRLAQNHFNKREFSHAIALWLAALDLEPNNERVQQRIEMLFDLKQKKDIALQRSKYNYRAAQEIMNENFEQGRRRAQMALDDYVAAYRIDPQDPDLQLMREDMRVLNEAVSAEAERRRLSEERRAQSLQLVAEAEAEMRAERYESALRLWTEALRLVPQDPDVQEGRRRSQLAIDNRIRFETIRNLLAEGKALFDRRDFSSARVSYQQVLNLDSRNREARIYMRNIDDELEKNRLYEQRLAQAEAFYQSALNHLAQNDFDNAISDFESARGLINNYRDVNARLREIPRLRDAHEARERQRRLAAIQQEFQTGLIAFSQSRFREAIVAFEKTLALDPGNTQAKEYLGRAREAEDERNEEIIDEFSPYYDIVNSLIVSGKALYERGMYVESRQKFDQILRLFPKNDIATEYLLRNEIRMNPDAYAKLIDQLINEARQEMESQNFRSATKKLELVRSVAPNHPGLNAHFAQVRTAETRRRAENVMASPAEIAQRLRVAANYFGQGGRENLESALREYRWVIARDPDNIQAAIGINRVESQLRIGGGAVAAAPRQLTEEQRILVNRHYYNGIQYYTNNDFHRAIEEWRRVLVIDPGHVKARNNIQKSLGFLGR